MGATAASNPAADWLAAEQELVWKPAVELRENGRHVHRQGGHARC